MRIALLGTRGVPARYGGFETAAEEIGARLVDRGHSVVVYCRHGTLRPQRYRGMALVHLPCLRVKSLETLSHTALSVYHLIWQRADVAVLFNAGNAPFIRLLQAAGVAVAVHMDGLEWKRAKWAGAGAAYYRAAESLAVRSRCTLIADARGIASYLQDRYGRESEYIAYGAPLLSPGDGRLCELGLHSGGYHLLVSRMEPENHVAEIVAGYCRSSARLPLIVVGAAVYGHYAEDVRAIARNRNVRFLGSVWDQELLNQLYANCRSYLHGHSVGGTNPSLLRALGCAAPVSAYDVVFNREVTGGHAQFFVDAVGVANSLEQDEADPARSVMRGRAGRDYVARNYRWDSVADDYERMLSETVARHKRRDC